MGKKQIHHGLVGLLGTALLSGCRVCPQGYTEKQENVCVNEEVKEEKELIWDKYAFEEVYTITTALATTLDAEVACAGISRLHTVGEQSDYAQCTTAYTQFQENLLLLSSEDVTVHTGYATLEVWTMGSTSGYFTGKSFSVVFKNIEQGVYLEGNVKLLEEGCHEDLDHYYNSTVCSSFAYEESDPDNEVALGCSMKIDYLRIRPASSFCGLDEWFNIQSEPNEFQGELVNEDLLMLHYDYSRALKELVLNAEE